ncbi:tetratricopeptide repeat protein [candidate division KSB1 bacterium]
MAKVTLDGLIEGVKSLSKQGKAADHRNALTPLVNLEAALTAKVWPETWAFTPKELMMKSPEIFNLMGIEYRMIGDHEKALESYGKALVQISRISEGSHSFDASEINNLIDEKSLAYTNIADIFRLQGKLKKAEENLRIAVPTARPGTMPFAKAQNQAGLVYVQKGKYGKAAEFYDRALKTLTKQKPQDVKQIYLTMGNLAEAERRSNYKGHIDDAEANFEGANLLAVMEGDRQWQANCLYGLAKCKMSRRDYEWAIQYLDTALHIDKELEFFRGQIGKYIHLAYCHAKLYESFPHEDKKELETATKHFGDAIKLIEKYNEKALTKNDKKIHKMRVMDIVDLIEPVTGTIVDSNLIKSAVEYFWV